MNYVVIMAGGSGERFWPLSRMARPKQLLKLTSATSMMIEEAIDRITPIVPLENILIITSERLQAPIREALPHLPPDNVIAEPAKRNTAPCLALGAAVIRTRTQSSDACMAVLTADHFIGDADAFRRDVSKALEFARTNDALVTMGIRPTRAETGYGYIEVSGGGHDAHDIVPVTSFKEKPDAATAADYVASGRYLWNSGMFFWSVTSLEKAMNNCLPEVGASIGPMTSTLTSNGSIAGSFAALPDISIDYGVMERANNVYVIPASFPWDDVGSWDALPRMQPQDDAGNVIQGNVIVVDARNNVIVNASSREHVLTTVGMHDHVVVITDDATMICPKDRAQDVKKIVTTLRAKGLEHVL
jgi:mannose-1-phosphate guanylyltransferase